MGFFDFFREQKLRTVGACFLCDNEVTEEVREDGSVASSAQWQLTDGKFLCDHCRQTRHLKKDEVRGHTSEEVAAAIVAHGFPSPADFHATDTARAFRVTLGMLDDVDNTFCFEYDAKRGLFLFPDGHLRQASQLISAELIENGERIRTGSLLAGHTTRDVCTEMKLLLTFNSLAAPMEEIFFVGAGAPVDSIDKDMDVYKDMQSVAQRASTFCRVLIHRQK